jgi:hypothetical protein
MEISRNAPATAQGELQIAGDPQTVFAVISAIDHWPFWNPDIKSVTLHGPVQPGTGFRWKSGPSTPHLDPPGSRPVQRDRLDGHDHGYQGRACVRFQANDGGTLARAPRSPGRACWPACSRATAASRWTRHPQRPTPPHGRGRAASRHGVSGLRGVTRLSGFVTSWPMARRSGGDRRRRRRGQGPLEAWPHNPPPGGGMTSPHVSWVRPASSRGEDL